MAEFLSADWIAALDAAARASEALADLDVERFVVEQRVDLAGGEVRVHHLALGPGGARVIAGSAGDADVVLHADLATAVAIARGEISAQQALSNGTLRVTGRLLALSRRAGALAAIDDVFAAVRADTTYPRPDLGPA